MREVSLDRNPLIKICEQMNEGEGVNEWVGVRMQRQIDRKALTDGATVVRNLRPPCSILLLNSGSIGMGSMGSWEPINL